jgi:6-phosphogluconolactonase/glucosamine-6-phosphate isomerase/deaminase
MVTKIFPDYGTLSRATADLIKNYIEKKPASLVCIASGHTPIGVFQNLVEDVRSKKINIDRCVFLGLDEWIGIDPTDEGSCLSMLKKDFFDPLGIQSTQAECFNVLAADLGEECNRMGVGTNGHIGMNEPGTSFTSIAHVGNLAEETIAVGQKYFLKQTKLSRGITLGLQHLRDAKLPIVMANGKKKAAIMEKAFAQKPSEQIPVTLVQLVPQGFVMLDMEAAQLLPEH